MINVTLGSKLRQMRKAKGWTQAYAAEQLGIARQTLTGYEIEIRDPSTEMLNKLAQIYGVTADYLLECADDLGTRLRKARVNKGYSLSDVAEKTGWHFTTIAAYERGEKMPPAEKVKILAELYDTTADYLLTGKNPPPLPSWLQYLPEEMKQKLFQVNPIILQKLLGILEKATDADLSLEDVESLLEAHIRIFQGQKKKPEP